MKADFKDRVTKRKRKSGMWLVLTLMCCAAGLIYFLKSKPPELIRNQISAPGATKQLIEQIKTPEKIAVEETRPPAAKQTVFNDQNYQPKGSINTIAPPPSRYYEQGQARTNAQVREINRSFNGVSNKRTIPWSWESQKTNRSGTFTFTESRNGINTMSVCGNYKRGSFIYRDCRKAAKRYFKDACSSQYRAACAAADMIP
ncbi:MAG: hypothetical protein RBR82_00570 [Pseudomonas sp.]|nr:hypothetical protein [Pseudomonas sp.]